MQLFGHVWTELGYRMLFTRSVDGRYLIGVWFEGHDRWGYSVADISAGAREERRAPSETEAMRLAIEAIGRGFIK